MLHAALLVVTACAAAAYPMFLTARLPIAATLRQEIAPRGMDLERVGRIMRQLGQALTAAHESRICHRDVKPENIMLQSLGESEEQAKLLDFGLAAPLDDGQGENPSPEVPERKVAGTPAYMAPEQVRGERLDGRCDLFALGCVLYELCAGVPPFRRDRRHATLSSSFSEDSSSPSRMVTMRPHRSASRWS